MSGWSVVVVGDAGNTVLEVDGLGAEQSTTLLCTACQHHASYIAEVERCLLFRCGKILPAAEAMLLNLGINDDHCAVFGIFIVIWNGVVVDYRNAYVEN